MRGICSKLRTPACRLGSAIPVSCAESSGKLNPEGGITLFYDSPEAIRADNSPSSSVPDLRTVVEHCLPKLEIISAVLDITDETASEATLRVIIGDLHC